MNFKPKDKKQTRNSIDLKMGKRWISNLIDSKIYNMDKHDLGLKNKNDTRLENEKRNQTKLDVYKYV